MTKIHYNIYRDGKFITTSFTYHFEATKEVYKDKGYTIERI